MLDHLGAGYTFHRIERERVTGLPVVQMFTAAMWYRIFLPELIPEADRVLYLDVDTIAVDDISPLWELDLGENYLAAVTNVLMPPDRERPASLGIASHRYFNSGVLLMNLTAMRADDRPRALYDFAAARPHLKWPDQDTLNVVLGARRLDLAPRWNAMNSLWFEWSTGVFSADELEEARKNPAIRHFEGPDRYKPWHHRAPREAKKLYARHRRKTPWPTLELDGEREPVRERWIRRLRSLRAS
jgi:lipopolysaccharide biosynthesis glycosyltransferase